MSTDRPDKTESPYTLMPGTFQIETSLYSISEDKSVASGGAKDTTKVVINDLHLRAGVTENGEIQFMIPSYIEEEIRSSGNRNRAYGVGDLVARYRHNMAGNAGGDFAWAVMPYLKVPTANEPLGTDEIEGGLYFPFGFKLPNEWSMGTMFGLHHAFDGDDDWRTDYEMTWVFSRSLVADLSGFFELYSRFSDQASYRAESTFDVGLTWQWAEDLQADAGIFLGITEAAIDQEYFLGLSWRI